MKKINALLYSSLLFCSMPYGTSCNKDSDIAEINNGENQISEKVITIHGTQSEESSSRMGYSDKTSGMEVTWSEGDVIYVGLKSQLADASIASRWQTYTLSSGSGEKKADFTGTGSWSTGNRLYACSCGDTKIYSTKVNNIYCATIDYKVAFDSSQKQTGNNNTEHLGSYDLQMASSLYTEGQDPTFIFKRYGAVLKFDITFPDDAIGENVQYIKIYSDRGEKIFVQKAYIPFDGSASSFDYTTDIRLSFSDVVVPADKKITAYMMVGVSNETDRLQGKNINLTVCTNDGTADRTYISTIKNTKAFEVGKKYTVTKQLISTKNLSTFFAGGDGLTEETAFRISSKEHLKNLAMLTNIGVLKAKYYYKVTNDIDLENENWIPIGVDSSNTTRWFQGQFDGGNFLISNFYQSISYYECGLFAETIAATLKNINLSGEINGTTISGFSGYIGGIVGFAFGGDIITNCTFKGTINVKNASEVGGIAGRASGKIINCKNYATIKVTADDNTAQNTNIGGINGSEGTIVGCFNQGDISYDRNITWDGYVYIGGITGQDANIYGCYASGLISSSSRYSNVALYHGGLMGYNNGGSYSINKSYWKTVTNHKATNGIGEKGVAAIAPTSELNNNDVINDLNEGIGLALEDGYITKYDYKFALGSAADNNLPKFIKNN